MMFRLNLSNKSFFLEELLSKPCVQVKNIIYRLSFDMHARWMIIAWSSDVNDYSITTE